MAIFIDSMKTSLSHLDKLSPIDLACLVQHSDFRLTVFFKHAAVVEDLRFLIMTPVQKFPSLPVSNSARSVGANIWLFPQVMIVCFRVVVMWVPGLAVSPTAAGRFLNTRGRNETLSR
jgi:hypothetical protein